RAGAAGLRPLGAGGASGSGGSPRSASMSSQRRRVSGSCMVSLLRAVRSGAGPSLFHSSKPGGKREPFRLPAPLRLPIMRSSLHPPPRHPPAPPEDRIMRRLPLPLFLAGSCLLFGAPLPGTAPPQRPLASPTEFRPDPRNVQRYGPAYRYAQAGWIVLHIEG